MSQMESFVGIDVSKARLDVMVIPTGERLTVSNDPDDDLKFFDFST